MCLTADGCTYPSFNKVNTYKWYKDRVKRLDDSHDPFDRAKALETALEWEDRSGYHLAITGLRVESLTEIWPGLPEPVKMEIAAAIKTVQTRWRSWRY